MMDPSDKALPFIPKSRLDGEVAGISLEKARWMVKNFLRDNGAPHSPPIPSLPPSLLISLYSHVVSTVPYPLKLTLTLITVP